MNKEDIERLVIEGPRLAVALSVDTCIFERDGYRLEGGRLKHLEQFRELPSTFLISDVVRREVLAHMVTKTVAAREALRKAMADVGDHWRAGETERDAALAALLGTSLPEVVAEERLASFLERCGATQVVADDTVGVGALMGRYFASEAPFEAAGAKKSEFPDAIALMSLEEWSRRNKKHVLVVSADRGWQTFAADSERLCCVESLEQALELFQRRDSTRAALLEHVAALLDKKRWDGLDELSDLLADATWIDDASAQFDYDIDMEVIVEKVEFSGDTAAEALRAIDYAKGALTVVAGLVAKVQVYADFSFNMEGVNLGNLSLNVQRAIEFEALLTFKDPMGAELNVSEMELVHRRQTIYFGHVEPDYSRENPNHEKY